MDARTLQEIRDHVAYKKSIGDGESWLNFVELLLAEVDSHSWIKITDDPQTLPKDGDPVWAFSPSQFIRVSPCWFRERGERWTSAHGQCVSLERGPTFRCDQSIGYYDVSQISHWMPRPFPAPPPES